MSDPTPLERLAAHPRAAEVTRPGVLLLDEDGETTWRVVSARRRELVATSDVYVVRRWTLAADGWRTAHARPDEGAAVGEWHCTRDDSITCNPRPTRLSPDDAATRGVLLEALRELSRVRGVQSWHEAEAWHVACPGMVPQAAPTEADALAAAILWWWGR